MIYSAQEYLIDHLRRIALHNFDILSHGLCFAADSGPKDSMHTTII